MNLREIIRKTLREDLQDKWNPINGLQGYNYQHGYCHYFAYNIIDKIRKRFPNKTINYYLILANEVDENTQEVLNEYLIHVYIKIDDLLLDSNGLTTMDKASNRLEDWEKRQRTLIPDDYEIITWEEETDEIPDTYFNNEFCNVGKIKKDIDTFLSNPIVQRILRDK